MRLFVAIIFSTFYFFSNALGQQLRIKGRIAKVHKCDFHVGTIINLEKPTGEMEITSTDLNGSFVFDSLERGRYRLFVNDRAGKIDTTFELSKSVKFKLKLADSCVVLGRKAALSDISSDSPKLLLLGGIAPLVTKDQKRFEETFNITYYDYGCESPATDFCLVEYNNTVFLYLDKRYGRKWRKNVRKDVVGL